MTFTPAAARKLSRNIALALAVTLAPIALSGCVGLGGGKAPANLFTLTPEAVAPAGTGASATKPGEAILVMEPDADRRLAALRVPVQVDAVHIAYLKDSVWIERPTRLFRTLLAETLRAQQGGLVLEDAQLGASAGTRLSGRLIDMGYDAPSQSVVVRFDAIRTGAKGEVATRRFESRIPGIAPKAQAVGPAINQAANQVAQQVAGWMAGG